jgi:hypothetical protein
MNIDGTWNTFKNVDAYFKDGDVAGIGVVHLPNSSMECFGTLNGKFLGKIIKIIKLNN